MVTVPGHPSPRSSVHRVCGQVSSFRPDVFTFRPDVSTFPANLPQMCPLGPRMCPPGPLTGDSSRPGPPGWSGSDFGGRAALGTRRASARGPGHLPTLADSPFRDPCVTLGRLPGRPSPPDRVRGRLQPAPTGRGGKSRRNFEDAGRCATVSQERGKRLSPRNIQGRKTTDHCGEWILIKVTHHLLSGRGWRRSD